jgi:hypothetical protein
MKNILHRCYGCEKIDKLTAMHKKVFTGMYHNDYLCDECYKKDSEKWNRSFEHSVKKRQELLDSLVNLDKTFNCPKCHAENIFKLALAPRMKQVDLVKEMMINCNSCGELIKIRMNW